MEECDIKLYKNSCGVKKPRDSWGRWMLISSSCPQPQLGLPLIRLLIEVRRTVHSYVRCVNKCLIFTSLKVEFFENNSWKIERLVSPTRKYRDFSVQKYGRTFWSHTLFYIFLNSKLGLFVWITSFMLFFKLIVIYFFTFSIVSSLVRNFVPEKSRKSIMLRQRDIVKCCGLKFEMEAIFSKNWFTSSA